MVVKNILAFVPIVWLEQEWMNEWMNCTTNLKEKDAVVPHPTWMRHTVCPVSFPVFHLRSKLFLWALSQMDSRHTVNPKDLGNVPSVVAMWQMQRIWKTKEISAFTFKWGWICVRLYWYNKLFWQQKSFILKLLFQLYRQRNQSIQTGIGRLQGQSQKNDSYTQQQCK